MQTSSARELQRIVEQIERLSEEQKALGGDIKDKFAEAKSKGFDVKILRKVIALRKLDETKRAEQEALVTTYCHALGMAGTPLGDYAERQLEAVA